MSFAVSHCLSTGRRFNFANRTIRPGTVVRDKSGPRDAAGDDQVHAEVVFLLQSRHSEVDWLRKSKLDGRRCVVPCIALVP